MSDRREAMTAFLARVGWCGIAPQPLAGDASFRSYYRVAHGARRAVVMDAPPGQEDVGRFVAVAAILRSLGLSAPEVFAEDRALGFLLLEDFGDATFTRLLAEGADEDALYALAVDALIALQRAVAARGLQELPPYDIGRLIEEVTRFADWYVPEALGRPLRAAEREEYLALWRGLLPAAAQPGPTLVLRDYHVDNLVRLSGREGVRACGILDFQDALAGPAAYDLVSLLMDARRDVAPALRRATTERYLAAFPALDRACFARSAAILAAQRNTKILGLFVRLWRRDGKPQYLVHLPRVWRLLEEQLCDPALAPLAGWFERHLPPARRRLPRARSAA
jgi:N-acetylmuramate 1-kinase